MAIDKKSKAYQSLLNNGYTDDQIMQMYNEASQWKNVWETVGSTVPENAKTSSTNDGTIKVWPQNANLNYYQYWDDSNPAQQWQKWWMNEKYTGEWVSNSYIEYNPDLTVADLDPNYLYWENARQQNRKEAWYIARRNDNIASALYNEWLTSREDVANFLSQQNEWMNSTEADRMNTIESVWKRLWQIKPEEEKPDLSKAEDIVQDTSGKLYGKVTAEEWNPKNGIDTLADANSVFKAMQESQVRNLQDFVSQDYRNIATCIVEWVNGWRTEQTWRDAQKYYPEFIAAVNEEVKRQRTQNAVNNISNWNTDYVTSEMDTKKNSISSSVENMASQYSNSTKETDSIKKDIENSVANNQTATEASDTMSKIEEEAAKLKNRLKNLREEANSKFKWDAPEYLVNAYINNKTQEIQNQLSILEDRYNAAYQRYTTQLNEKWKQKQYDLEERQLKLQEDKFEYEKQQTNAKNNVIEKDGKFYQISYTDEGVSITEMQVQKQYTDSWMKWAWLRNNNPWNIKDDDFWNVVWHDSKWFAIFATPEDWFDALVEKIKYNQTNPNSRYYWTTIREYFRIYAPSSDWNNPDAYANSVAKQLWVSVDTPIKDLDPVKFAAVIAKHDSGYNYDTYGQFRWWATWDTTTSSNITQTFTDRDYALFESFMSPDTSSSDKKSIAEQYWFKDDLEWMTKFVNRALDNRDSKKNFDINTIEVPDDVYVIEDEEKKVSRRVDPNSEEWRKLAQQYRISKAKELWYMDESWTLIADSDWKNTAAYRIISSDWETPLIFRQRLYNLVPTQLKNSEKELENLYEIAKQLYKAWYSADEASMVFYWVDPREDKTWMLKNLIYKSRMWEKLWDSYYWDLWWLVDAWMLDEAVAKVETSVLPSKYVDKETRAISIIKKIDRLRDKLKEADSVVWPFEWSIEKFKNEYVDWWWKYQQVASDIVQIYSDIRRDLMGSAVTDTELKVNEDMFPSMNDKMKSIKVKIQSLENSLIDDLNWYRDVYKLPELTKQSLLNQSLRKYQYWYGWWTDSNNWDNNSWWTDLS